MTVSAEPTVHPALSPRARAVLDDLLAQGIGDDVAAWRDNALASGQAVTGADQRRFATAVIHDRLRQVAERDIANGVGALDAAEDAEVVRSALDDLFGAGTLDRLLADPLVENVDAVNKKVGQYVEEAKLPTIGAPKSDSYEGDGYVVVRDPSTEVVKRLLKTIIETMRVSYAG